VDGVQNELHNRQNWSILAIDVEPMETEVLCSYKSCISLSVSSFAIHRQI